MQELPSPEPRTARTSELNGSGKGRGKGIRGPMPFVPVGTTNRDQRHHFCPDWWLQPGKRLRGPFVPVGATNRDKRPPLLSQLVSPTETKGPCPPPLPRLAVGPGTKAAYCPGPKGCRNKWLETKACSVVVF